MSPKHWMTAGATAAALFTADAARAQDVYLKLFGGLSMPQSEDFQLNGQGFSRSSGFDFDSGYAAGAALGFAYSPNVGIEIEYAYRNADATLEGTRNTGDGSAAATAFMVNAVYSFPPVGATGSVRPYLGAGLGVGDLSYDRDSVEVESDYSFAYQFIGGIAYDVSYQASLFTEIRYFGINDQTLEGDGYDLKTGYGSVDVLVGYAYRF